MSGIALAIVVGINLALIYLLMAVPLGIRTIRVARRIPADPARIWNALWPLGTDSGWSGEILSATAHEGREDLARLRLSWEGRDGQPIERLVALSEARPRHGFVMRVLDDTSLDAAFWNDFSETTEISPDGGETLVSVSQTDSYRGVAFLAFRYFRLRRTLAGLQRWALTGHRPARGVFEHPLTQFGFAVLSALILWALFGFTAPGLLLAVVLTMVVALHELGHMAAFRVMGHKRVRMIFVPVLGGIAIGGRPYDSRFEVGFVALMGAGFSALLVPLFIAASSFASSAGNTRAAAGAAVFAGVLALFNLANLVPVWRFDGGQVLRQICRGKIVLVLASFALLAAFMAVALLAGFEARIVYVAGAVFAVLSLITAGDTVQPRHALKPVRRGDGLALGAALVATFVIHASALIWLADRYPIRDLGEIRWRETTSITHGEALATGIGTAQKGSVFPERDAMQSRIQFDGTDGVAQHGQVG